jgi:dipeptidyl aminopeptidase/acylaminoacyl peptidase
MLLAAVALASTLTIEDYATMPSISAPRLSPDGKRIAYVLTRADLARSEYDSDLWLIDADGRHDVQLTHATGSDTHPRWSPDGTRVAFLSDRETRNAVWLIDPRGGEPWKLTGEPGPIREFEWSPDGKSIAFIETDPASGEREDVHIAGERRQAHLYIIDVATRAVRRLTRGAAFSINNLSWTPDSRTIVIERLPGLGLDDLYHTDLYTIDAGSACEDNACPKMTPLVVRDGGDRSPQVSPDGKRVAFVSMGGVLDWLREQRLWVVDLASHETRLVSRDYDGSPETLRWADANTIVFDGPVKTTTQIFTVRLDDSQRVTSHDGVASGVDVDPQSGRIAYVFQSLTNPPELFSGPSVILSRRSAAKDPLPTGDTDPSASSRLRMTGGSVVQLTHHNDELRAKKRPETRLIRWKNPKDGLEIEGLLTLPLNYERGKRVPLLTFVHGGPASHFDQAFLGYLASLYVPDVLASNGFAVLRPNPRGTGGYGERFLQANRNDWLGAWDDINAGIDRLIADGIVDPDRLGMMGWSYGGFITSWAVGHSDRLKAISIGAPVTDLLTFHGTTDIREFIPSFFPAMSLEMLRAQSPVWHLKKTNAHVLIEHGEADERVPLSQGTMLYRLLQELGVDVEMVTYPRSHHVPSEPRQRIDVARRNVDFFTKWVR